MAQQKTDTQQTDIATYRVNRPRGEFCENSFVNTELLREFLLVCKVWNHKLGAFPWIIIGKGRCYLQSNMSHLEYSVEEFEN